MRRWKKSWLRLGNHLKRNNNDTLKKSPKHVYFYTVTGGGSFFSSSFWATSSTFHTSSSSDSNSSPNYKQNPRARKKGKKSLVAVFFFQVQPRWYIKESPLPIYCAIPSTGSGGLAPTRFSPVKRSSLDMDFEHGAPATMHALQSSSSLDVHRAISSCARCRASSHDEDKLVVVARRPWINSGEKTRHVVHASNVLFTPAVEMASELFII